MITNRHAHGQGRILLTLVCCLACLAGLTPTQAGQALLLPANTIVVSTTADASAGDGKCSLREAIRAANQDAIVDACPAGFGTDTILLGAGTYGLTIGGINENAALSGDLDITGNLNIIGVSPTDTIIDGNQLDRLFEVIGATLRVSKLTLRRGMIPSGGLYGGGAILNNSSSVLDLLQVVLRDNVSAKTGGAIDNAGNAHLNYVTLDDNQSTPGGYGGAIFNSQSASLLVENSTFSNNSAFNTDTLDYGGGLYNSNIVTLINVTFSGNAAEWGGGIFNDGNDANVYSSTFSNNTSGIHNQASLRIKNSILTYSSGMNCDGINEVTSLGHNIDNTDSCNFNFSGDLTNTDPGLGPLMDNLGSTLTHALLVNSPAIDSGDPVDCPDIDQRGAYRPADGDVMGGSVCDIGAYERLADFPSWLYLPLIARLNIFDINR
jgi:CSLREA domain-containing protein